MFQENVLVSYKRDKSLRDELVHSNFRIAGESEGITRRCQRTRCITCSYVMNVNQTVKGPHCTCKAKGEYSCISQNVIYCFSCDYCGIFMLV